jgi:hypothetical protein
MDDAPESVQRRTHSSRAIEITRGLLAVIGFPSGSQDAPSGRRPARETGATRKVAADLGALTGMGVGRTLLAQNRAAAMALTDCR